MGRKGRGWKKRKSKCWFQTSNTQRSQWLASQSRTSQTGTHLSVKSYRRLIHREFEDTFNHDEGVFTPNADGILESSNRSSPGILLLPLRHELSHVEDTLKERNDAEEVSGYTDVHLPTYLDAIQDVIIEHSEHSPACPGRLVRASNLITKWGVSAIIQLKCNTCKYVSSKRKLFREVPKTGKGRKAAEPNRSFALGLCNTSIASTGAQRLLSSMNKTCPAPSALQKQLNQVGNEVKKLNENNMAAHRGKLKDTLEIAGFPCDTSIPAECDRQYNNSLRNSRRKTPFASATQTRDVLAENLTPMKKIIAFNHAIKLLQTRPECQKKRAQSNLPRSRWVYSHNETIRSLWRWKERWEEVSQDTSWG